MRVSKNDVVQKMIGFRKLGVQNMKGLENNFRNEGCRKRGVQNTRGSKKRQVQTMGVQKLRGSKNDVVQTMGVQKMRGPKYKGFIK